MSKPVEITDTILSSELAYKQIGDSHVVAMFRPVVQETPPGTWKVVHAGPTFEHCGGEGHGAGHFDPLRPCHYVKPIGVQYFMCAGPDCRKTLQDMYPGTKVSKIE